MTISIDINLRDSTCFIECYTWNDFGGELQTILDATDTTKWKREYSDVLSNGNGYIARYVLFVIRRDGDNVLNKFTFTPEEQYQHVYLSPQVNTVAPIDVAQHRYT